MSTPPLVADCDFTLYVGDASAILAEFPTGSVDCIITSPPYWQLRDYGIPSQIGLEQTRANYLAVLTQLFRDARRVLADHGSLWLNLGDSYNSNESGSTLTKRGRQKPHNRVGRRLAVDLKPKDMVGMPWEVAFALRQDGWWLRSDVIWSKPNAMPESVTDRPTKSHEYVFLLTKRAQYFYDQEAVREPHSPDGRQATMIASNGAGVTTHENYRGRQGAERWPNSGRNSRSVWEIPTQPTADAHFATYPEELVRRCLLASCPEWVCTVCGSPRQREVSITYVNPGNRQSNGARKPEDHRASGVRTMAGGKRLEKRVSTDGWSDCGHGSYRPGIVLDPFMGSGTTALVARKHGRHSVGIELNAEYADMAARRLQQLSLLAE